MYYHQCTVLGGCTAHHGGFSGDPSDSQHNVLFVARLILSIPGLGIRVQCPDKRGGTS